jgi:hypothetical protein
MPAPITDQVLLRDLCHQNWELSRIVGEKYRDYRDAWCCMILQHAALLLLVIVLMNTNP